jgi:predicted RND superfamily exporter protein
VSLRRATEALFLAAGRRPLRVFGATAAILVLSLAAASRLHFDPDVLRLLPAKNPDVLLFRETLERFGSADYFVAGVRVPEGAPLDPYEGFADLLAERMQASGLFSVVEHRIGEPEDLLSEFLPRAALFLDEGGRQRLAARLDEAAIRGRAADLRRLLETPQAVAWKQLIKLDPLGVADVFLDRVGGSRGPLAVDWTSGRYLSRDHRLLLVLGKPLGNPQDLEFNKRLRAAVSAEVDAARAGWDELAEDSVATPPEVFFGGRYMIVLDDSGLIARDVIVNAATSLIGVLGLFYLAYRRASLLLLVFSPLACGLAITFGFSALAVGVLASTTAGVAALLVGLGDDFVIVLYGRYLHERQRGMPHEAALRSMGGATARGVILGAVTTAATFYAFLITDFTGLWQMGLIVGTGILFCLLAVLVLVPAMIGWSEAHHRKHDREPPLHLFAFGIEHLARLSVRQPRVVLGVALAVTLAALAALPRLKFDDNVEALRPRGNRGVLALEEIKNHFGTGFDSMSLVLEAPTLDGVLALAGRASTEGRALVAAGRLGGFDAVTSVLPPVESQRQSIDWLARERAGGRLDPERVKATFVAAVEAEGLRAEPFAHGLDLLTRTLTPIEPLTRDAVLALPQGRSLLDRYLRETPRGWTSVVQVYNLPGRPKREVPEAALELAERVGPGARLTGMNVLSRGLRFEVRRDAAVSAAIGLALVVVLLWVDFREWRSVLLALVPLALGIVWMIAAMVALDLHMNFMNIFVITMIIGIGVDYGIHVIHRYREEAAQPDGDLEAAIEETARGVFLAALTTIVGFGSLATSHYPGLISMGAVSILGTLATALIAILVIPAWLTWRASARTAKPR